METRARSVTSIHSDHARSVWRKNMARASAVRSRRTRARWESMIDGISDMRSEYLSWGEIAIALHFSGVSNIYGQVYSTRSLGNWYYVWHRRLYGSQGGHRLKAVADQHQKVVIEINRMLREGISNWNEIVAELGLLGYKSRLGSQYSKCQVMSIFKGQLC